MEMQEQGCFGVEISGTDVPCFAIRLKKASCLFTKRTEFKAFRNPEMLKWGWNYGYGWLK
jgi:hypothetical protein